MKKLFFWVPEMFLLCMTALSLDFESFVHAYWGSQCGLPNACAGFLLRITRGMDPQAPPFLYLLHASPLSFA
jgi:hypothetical protein